MLQLISYRDMKQEELTYLINGCAMKVHSNLGTGFQEVIYQRALEIELKENNLEYIREEEKHIYYVGKQIGTRRADFIIEDKVVLEIKAVTDLLPVHLAQAKNYVTAYDMPIGLLINFGARSLQFKKIFNSNPNYSN